jgi:hypothetical protein
MRDTPQSGPCQVFLRERLASQSRKKTAIGLEATNFSKLVHRTLSSMAHNSP